MHSLWGLTRLKKIIAGVDITIRGYTLSAEWTRFASAFGVCTIAPALGKPISLYWMRHPRDMMPGGEETFYPLLQPSGQRLFHHRVQHAAQHLVVGRLQGGYQHGQHLGVGPRDKAAAGVHALGA